MPGNSPMRFTATTPITAGTEMADIFIPHPYQHDIIDWICAHQRCAVWASMGAGKTVATLTALDRLNFVDEVFPALVLAPLRVARATWGPEAKKWSHLEHLQVRVITGSSKQREQAATSGADIYCMNYENLEWLVSFFGDKWPFRTVVADEATKLKSFRIRQGSKRAAALGKVAHTHVTRFINLTGTPAANGVRDLWGSQYFLDRGERLGKTFSAFEQRWFRKGYDGFSLQPQPHAQEEIQAKLRDICLTVTGLPVDEPIRNTIYVDLPPKARRAYDDMEEEMFAQIGADGVEAANAAVRTGKCLQIANGAIYTEAPKWEALHDAKLEALDSVIEEAGGAPVLVAYNFKHDLERLRRHLPAARTLDADPDTIRQWNAGRIPILLAHPASAGHGLNLADGGNILAFFGLDWSLETHMQIIERIGPCARSRRATTGRCSYTTSWRGTPWTTWCSTGFSRSAPCRTYY